MKKILITRFPIVLATVTLLIVTSFLRYNLYLNSNQLAREFLNQNANELYSMDTLKVSSRLNSFSRALNWVCIEGEVNSNIYFSMKNGNCESGLFQQHTEIKIPEANNSKISFTLKTSKELQLLFVIFFILQIALIATLIVATKKSEEEKMKNERAISKLSRKMFHDIRSPLASLNTIAETTKFDSTAEHEIFKTSILRINDIANTLLRKTRSNANALPAYVNLQSIIPDIIEEKLKEYLALNLKIEFDNDIITFAYLEPLEFKRLFSNLINNSIEASQDNPKIKISLSMQNKKLELIISDNGAGISKKIVNQLGIDEITTKKNGNGIGLKDAMESMLEWGGSLDIIETSKLGTKIKLSFLAREENNLFILIDDDGLTRMTWETKARKAGVQLKTFASPEDFHLFKNTFSKNSILYIDSELGDVKGESLALELHNEGFINISLTTGHPSVNFRDFKFLKSVISKSAPF